MTRFFTVTIFSLYAYGAFSQSLDGHQVGKKSIEFHDPDGNWATTHLILDLNETRPNGPDRNTLVEIDNNRGYFNLIRSLNGNSVRYQIQDGICQTFLNDNPELTNEQIESFNLTCERAEMLRNYYTYLWGMPMKLNDPGTNISKDVVELKFNEKDSYRVKVTYNEDVGSDTWYFYFNKHDFSLHAYQFYHDESVNDGEYIMLNDLKKVGRFYLPESRAWYVNKDSKHLGTDTLQNAMIIKE